MKKKSDLKDSFNLMPKNNYSIVKMGLVERHSRRRYGQKEKKKTWNHIEVILSHFN